MNTLTAAIFAGIVGVIAGIVMMYIAGRLGLDRAKQKS